MHENQMSIVMYGNGGAAVTLDEPAAPLDAAALRYLGRRTLFVRGAVTGRLYMARPRVAPLVCDVRDAPALLASPLFKRFTF